MMFAPASKNVNVEGAYRIYYMEGCLTGMHLDRPLTIMSPEHERAQIWEVKKQGNDEYLIVLKSDPNVGASYPKELHPTSPVVLGRQPCKFKMMAMEQPNHFV
nr:conserved hypothetical protein [Melanopsichium pennsylvanicum 4]